MDLLEMTLNQLDEHWRGRTKEDVAAEIAQRYDGFDRVQLESLNRSRSES